MQQLVQRAAQATEFLQRRQSFGDAAKPEKIRWHLIGHLQRNKVKQLLPAVSMIHSIDSLRLAEELDTVAEKLGKKGACAAAGERQRRAAESQALPSERRCTWPSRWPRCRALCWPVLMTMAEHEASEAKLRQTFARTREVFEEIPLAEKSAAHLSATSAWA